jgi:maleylpyruvate isomerase
VEWFVKEVAAVPGDPVPLRVREARMDMAGLVPPGTWPCWSTHPERGTPGTSGSCRQSWASPVCLSAALGRPARDWGAGREAAGADLGGSAGPDAADVGVAARGMRGDDELGSPDRIRAHVAAGGHQDGRSGVPPCESLRELAVATDQLLAGLSGLSDDEVARPSLLPGWTRGHVLTHLARNAEGGERLLEWARTGLPTYEYESLSARAADIEAGARRPAAVLVEDVRQTAERFVTAASAISADAWLRVVRYTAGQERRAEVIVPARLTEVLIHHVDISRDYRPQDWPAWFTSAKLAGITASLNRRNQITTPVVLEATDTGTVTPLGAAGPDSPRMRGPGCELLAWLYGRSDGSRLTRLPDGALPDVPPIF